MEKREEQELIQLSLKGDESAFASLIRPYKNRIHSLCRQVLHDQERAEDLSQETFIHAFRHLSEFRQEARFYTWIYRIALNLSLNALRKKKTKERETLVSDLEKKTARNYGKKEIPWNSNATNCSSSSTRRFKLFHPHSAKFLFCTISKACPINRLLCA